MKRLLTIWALCLSLTAYADSEWRDTVQVDVGHPRMFHLRSNLLHDVLLVPNVGLECSVGRHWSLLADGSVGWWCIDRKHRYWRLATGEVELRYWQ